MSTRIGYKKKLINAMSLKSAGVVNLHERVQILVDVFEDADFRGDNAGDDYTWAALLDQYVSDVGFSFLELRSIYQVFSDVDSWSKAKSISVLHDEALASLASRKQPTLEDSEESVNKRTRTSVKLADFNRVKDQLEDKTFQHKSLLDEVTVLRDEVQSLRMERAHLEGRVAEMERVLDSLGAKALV